MELFTIDIGAYDKQAFIIGQHWIIKKKGRLFCNGCNFFYMDDTVALLNTGGAVLMQSLKNYRRVTTAELTMQLYSTMSDIIPIVFCAFTLIQLYGFLFSQI